MEKRECGRTGGLSFERGSSPAWGETARGFDRNAVEAEPCWQAALAGGNYCSLPAFARTEKLSAINSG
jgi:hypothetical protein